jgi:large subunit ribosomal protein L17
MRHRVDHRKLGRTHSHRKAMFANMVTSLFEKERIRTTDAKAKEARRYAERLITRAKKGYAAYQEHRSLMDAGKDEEGKQMQAVALSHWRQAARVVKKRAVLKKLFETIAPQFMEREGGYTRILHLRNRQGDNAKTVLLELVGTKVTEAPVRRKPRKKEAGEAAEETSKEEAKGKGKKKAAKKEEAEAKKEAAREAEEAEAAGAGDEAAKDEQGSAADDSKTERKSKKKKSDK